MGIFRRLAHIFFGLIGLICLVALAAPWIGPYTHEAATLFELVWYRYALYAVLAITALGLLFFLLKGLFAPRHKKTVVVTRAGYDEISVATAAISSQAAYIVETGGRNSADKVNVTVTGKDSVRVSVRVRPAFAVDVAEEGLRLHDDLVTGLSRLCGGAVQSIQLEFVESDSPAAGPESVHDWAEHESIAVEADDVRVERVEASEPVEALAAEEPTAPEPAPQTSEITVPMGHVVVEEEVKKTETTEVIAVVEQEDGDALPEDDPAPAAEEPDAAEEPAEVEEAEEAEETGEEA